MGEPRLLVTGGSGFIGSAVIRIARARGFAIRNLDFRPPNLPEQQAHWVNVDVRSQRDVEREMLAYRPDFVLHMASDIDVTLKTLDEYRTTTLGTTHVLQAAAQLPDLRRLIHVSTQFVVRPGRTPQSETCLLYTSPSPRD